jgi:hypothetical protein
MEWDGSIMQYTRPIDEKCLQNFNREFFREKNLSGGDNAEMIISVITIPWFS